MKKSIVFGLAIIALSMLWGIRSYADPKAASKSEVPPVMYGFLSHVLNLQPYLYSKEAFESDQNQKLISQELQEFSDQAAQLKKHDRLKTPGFMIPASVVIKQLHDINEAYQKGHRGYAWSSLRSTLHNCSQCHTQVSKFSGKKQAPLWKFENQTLPKDPMELGDFWYMIRAYDKAFEQFSKVVREYGKVSNDQFRLKKALRYILTIALRIDQSPDKAIQFIDSLENRKHFPKYLQTDMEVWKNELSILKMLPPMNIETVSVRTLEQTVEDLFRSAYPIPRENRSKEIAMEYGSGLLFDFVNHRPKEATQRMYYWLGISTIELNRLDYPSFGDPYLKECIEKFPNTPISVECYSALQDEWYFDYSGSAGVFLPKSYKEELNRLEKILNTK